MPGALVNGRWNRPSTTKTEILEITEFSNLQTRNETSAEPEPLKHFRVERPTAKIRGTWFARIKINGKKHHLGTYTLTERPLRVAYMRPLWRPSRVIPPEADYRAADPWSVMPPLDHDSQLPKSSIMPLR